MQERLMQTVEEITQELPLTAQTMVKMFLPSFRQLCESADDEKIIELCDFITDRVNYIKNGDTDE